MFDHKLLKMINVNSRISVPLIKCTHSNKCAQSVYIPPYPPSRIYGFTIKLTDESKEY